MRAAAIHHCTSEPFRFFGRAHELSLLDGALGDDALSLVALIGPGGQGKTAIVQHWLQQLLSFPDTWDGLFFWSFYRGKDVDVFLRELYAYAEGAPPAMELSASFCVDRLLPRLWRERWVLILDGTEVVQYENGPWADRFLHPEFGRLLEELASAPLPGVVLLTTRFALPTLERRRHARVLTLGKLDAASGRQLLASLGVNGTNAELDAAAGLAGWHAKGVELLGTWLRHFGGAQAARCHELPDAAPIGGSEEEQSVARVLAAFQHCLPPETCDILALATAFRQPPSEPRLLEYLGSQPVAALLHQTWQRTYGHLNRRATGWLQQQVDFLVRLRLLERVASAGQTVIDAHPLVRRGFEQYLGAGGQRQGAAVRAGFLRARPDRRPPRTLDEAHEEVEMFHAYCDAGLWNEADTTLTALNNPKHRFLAPAFERDLLLRFFPGGDWRNALRWPGFGRWRSLAISLEMLGEFEDALEVYRPEDAGLRGDALIALGRLQPMLSTGHVPAPWQTLWNAYRAHALCLAGRTDAALALARTLVPVDIYEWLHLFECLLRLGQLKTVDLRGLLHRPERVQDQRWASLARQRLEADYIRVTQPLTNCETTWEDLTAAYDQGGLPYERALVRLSHARHLLRHKETREAAALQREIVALAGRHGMHIVLADAWELAADIHGDPAAVGVAARLREEHGYHGPARP